MDAEDARTDFILAAATALAGPLLIRFLLRVLPISAGTANHPLALSARFLVLTALVPLLLARHRKQGRRAFGLDGPPSAMITGLVLVVPFVVLAALDGLLGPPPHALTQDLLGRLYSLRTGGMVAVWLIVQLAAIIVGTLLLYTFLVVRARDGFRQTSVTQLEALRTYGMGAAGGAFVVALLLSLTPINPERWRPSFQVLALVGLVLVADRLVEQRAVTTRATVLAPAVVALLNFFSFRGDLLTSLFAGLMAACAVIVLAVVLEDRRRGWAVVPLVTASVVWPTVVQLW